MVLLSRVNIERGMKVAELEEQTLIDQDALVQSV